MSNAFWHRFRSSIRTSKADAVAVAVVLLIGSIASALGGADRWMLDIAQIARGQLWRLLTVHVVAASPLVGAMLIALLVWMVPRLVLVLGRWTFWFFAVLLVMASNVATMLVMTVTGLDRVLHPIPPLAIFATITFWLVARHHAYNIGGRRIRSASLAAIACLGLALWTAMTVTVRPALFLVMLGQWFVSAALAFAAVGVVYYRSALKQFRRFQRSVVVTTEPEDVEMYRAEARPSHLPAGYSSDEEYADALLEKIFRHGESSLTDDERAFLRDYARRL
jgi:hypothetical protein